MSVTREPTATGNRYGSALIALIGGGVIVAAYTALAHVIPLAVIGVIIPLMFALVAIFYLHGAVRGSGGFLAGVALVGAILNIATSWFVYIGLVMGFETAITVFTQGPSAVWDTVNYFAEFGALSFGDITSSAAITISGGWLVALWVLDALILSAAVWFGYREARESQHVSSKEALREAGGNIRTEVLPALGGVGIGAIKGLLQIGAVFLAVYLLSEYVF